VHISASFALPARAWELAPGLWFKRLSGPLKDELIAAESRIKPSSGIAPNYTVKIDSIGYGNHIRARLANEGKTAPDVPEDLDAVGIDAINITKMVLIAFLLQRNLTFAFANAHSFEVLPSGIYNEHHRGIVVNTRQESLSAFWGVFPHRPSNSINRRTLRDILDSIERYYRPFTWEMNRVSTALTYFWSAVAAHEPREFFTNLAILLECLLGTGAGGVTHVISERAATILGKNSNDRLSKYKDVRSIYGQRSKIVHGEGVVSKGPIGSDTFIVSPKYTLVPKTLMRKVLDISIDLLNTLLRDDEYMALIRARKSEGKIDEDLNALFMKRLFDP
jgi:hypothetical protein